MPEEQEQKNWFKGSVRVGWVLLKGLLVPVSAGFLMWIISYPLSYYSCSSYADAIEHPYKFQFFKCYIQSDNKRWLERTEYQSLEVGVKLVISPDIKIP